MRRCCLVCAPRDGHRGGRTWRPNPGFRGSLFQEDGNGSNISEGDRESGWRAGRTAHRAESSSPLTCAGPKKMHQQLLAHSLPSFLFSFFHTQLFLQSEVSRINVLVHSNHTPKLCPCSSPTNSCLITLRPRGHIPVRLHPQEDKPREKSLQALEVGLGLFGQSIPKYWVSGACSRTQTMCFRREYFFGPMSILFCQGLQSFKSKAHYE